MGDRERFYCGRCGGWVKHLVCERVAICCTCGLEQRANKTGKGSLGRHLTAAEVGQIRSRLAAGQQAKDIAAAFGIKQWTVYSHCKDLKKTGKRGRKKGSKNGIR